MRSILFIISIVIASCTMLGACKKDLLHFQQVQQLDSHTTTDRLNNICFINNHVGFICGGQRFYDAYMLMTTDGGYSWQKVTLPASAIKGLYGMTQAPDGYIYAIGFDGKLLYSADTGQTWQLKQLQFLAYSDIAFSSNNRAIAIGGVSFNSGYRMLMDAAGNQLHWDSLSYQLNKVKMVDATTGYICGYGVMLKTTDAGSNWSVLDIGGDNFTNMDVHGNEIWLCGYNGSVFHSTDGGANWERLRNGNDIAKVRYHLLAILFKDSSTGWAVGENGKVIHTDDGGHHWEEYEKFTDNALRSMILTANGDLIVAGDNGALYRLAGQ